MFRINTSGSPGTSGGIINRLTRARHGALLGVLFLLLPAIYANSFNGAFIFDDGPNIVENPRVHLQSLDRESLAGAMQVLRNRIDRPPAYLSFSLNHYVHDNAPSRQSIEASLPKGLPDPSCGFNT